MQKPSLTAFNPGFPGAIVLHFRPCSGMLENSYIPRYL